MDTITKVVDILMTKWEEQQQNNPYEQHGLLYCSAMSFPMKDVNEKKEIVVEGTHVITYYN